MVNTDKLLGIIAERRTTQKAVAKALKISPKTFYAKMEKRVFRSDEMDKMIEFLKIENPIEIFFACPVTSQVTDDKINENA